MKIAAAGIALSCLLALGVPSPAAEEVDVRGRAEISMTAVPSGNARRGVYGVIVVISKTGSRLALVESVNSRAEEFERVKLHEIRIRAIDGKLVDRQIPVIVFVDANIWTHRLVKPRDPAVMSIEADELRRELAKVQPSGIFHVEFGIELFSPKNSETLESLGTVFSSSLQVTLKKGKIIAIERAPLPEK
jgi:hypothetical protein